MPGKSILRRRWACSCSVVQATPTSVNYDRRKWELQSMLREIEEFPFELRVEKSAGANRRLGTVSDIKQWSDCSEILIVRADLWHSWTSRQISLGQADSRSTRAPPGMKQFGSFPSSTKNDQKRQEGTSFSPFSSCDSRWEPPSLFRFPPREVLSTNHRRVLSWLLKSEHHTCVSARHDCDVCTCVLLEWQRLRERKQD